MLTDNEIKASALKLYGNGITPSIRKVVADLGGGDWNRISRILRELNLGTPLRKQEPACPPSIAMAVRKHGREEYERGRADAMRLVEEKDRTIAMLEAQIKVLKETLAEQESTSRAASPRQIRNIVEDTLASFLGEVRPDRTGLPKVPTVAVQKQENRAVTIDGMTGTDIIRTPSGLLTEAQLAWKRQYQRDADHRRTERRLVAKGDNRAGRKRRQAPKREPLPRIPPDIEIPDLQLPKDVFIDGRSGTEIMSYTQDALTPAQNDWKRRYKQLVEARKINEMFRKMEQFKASYSLT